MSDSCGDKHDARLTPQEIADGIEDYRSRGDPVPVSPASWETIVAALRSSVPSSTASQGDSPETVQANPESVAAWKREAERYRKGMENWKATAEAKDAALVSAIERKPEIPVELFDGMAVFLEADRNAGPDHTLKSHHVSAVLDAVVRLIRKRQREQFDIHQPSQDKS